MEIEYTESAAVIETHTHSSAKAYVARITGTHPRYKLQRDFCRKDDVTSARTNTYRELEFYVELGKASEGAVYQYRGLDASSSGGENGYWRVRNGELIDCSYSDALAKARELDGITA